MISTLVSFYSLLGTGPSSGATERTPRLQIAANVAGWLALVAFALGLPSLVQANEGPVEQAEIALTRTSTSGQALNARLSKNVYRYSDRQVTETVQVPYTIEVPYTDYEEYVTYEQRCVYTPQQFCRNESRCSPGGSSTRMQCRDHRVCRSTPRGQECTNRRECHPVQVPSAPVCRSHRVCHVENRMVCSNHPVRHSRPITRYRTETRYRSEQQTRTVTDKFFVRQWATQVAVGMPEDTLLENGEQETLLIRLSGDEASPEVSVNVDSSIYNYRIQSQTYAGGVVKVVMEQVAKYEPQELAEQTILNLALAKSGAAGFRVQFEDRGIVPRTSTHYELQIFDKDLNRTVFETRSTGSFGSHLVQIPVTAAIDSEHDHLIRLSVRREGTVLSRPVDFEKEAHQTGLLDASIYADVNGVRDFTIEGSGLDSRLAFVDQTPGDHKVETRYEIQFVRKLRVGWGDWTLFEFFWDIDMGTATVVSNQLTRDGDGKIRITLNGLSGLKQDDLRNHFRAGEDVIVKVNVMRISPRLGGASPIRFAKEARMKVR